MSTAAAGLTFPFMTGFCGYSGMHSRCPGQVTGRPCTCPCHSSAPAVTLVPVAPDSDQQERQGDPVDVDLGDVMQQLAAAVDGLNRALPGFDGIDIELLDLLGRVRAQRVALAALESLVERRAAKEMTQDLVVWDGGTAERRRGKDRKEWQHEDLTRAITQRIVEPLAVDETTGEVDSGLAAVLHDAISQFAATHRPEWRVTAVKPLGIDVDQYCHAVPGRTTVQITLAEPAEPQP